MRIVRLAVFVKGLLLLGLPSLAAVAQEPAPAPEVVQQAFARAGDNRAQLEQAWGEVPDAQRSSLAFLLEHMPDGDARALSAAFLLPQIELAHTARAAVPWGATLADELFCNDVLPYAQANEAREDWRSDFVRRFLPLVTNCKTPGEAGLLLNGKMFEELNVHYSTGRARADQAPSSSIAQHKASCTGLSILLADACRACCIPARLVSVRWPHKAGNHTWVEIWDGQAWRFVGADEPDPKGFDRAWFVGDAAKAAAAADARHHPWAVSFAKTQARFAAGWGRGIELWGVDVASRYAAPAPVGAQSAAPQGAGQDDALQAQLDRFFAATAERRATFEFDRNLDAELQTTAGDARLRAAVFAAWKRSERALLAEDHAARRVRAGDKESPFTVKEVGEKPAGGWPLVIAMHGGGGVAKRVNDSQWRHMQIYYQDHPEVSGYLYCALRAPTDEWNGFYTGYFYPVLEKLIRQFVVCDDVDPSRVIAIGYSHGGYGAFALGTKLPHRFAAVHASAAAPSDGDTLPFGLHSLHFSFMVGGKDTAYGRRERCEKFAAQIAALQPQLGAYPGGFTLVEGNGHTGLPDRDLLATLLPHVRDVAPKMAWCRFTDDVVREHYWLRVPQAKKGLGVMAVLDEQLTVHADAEVDVEVLLDARLWDMGEELPVLARRGDVPPNKEGSDGAAPTRVATLSPSPSLRTLCATMVERGDPSLAATWVVRVPVR